MFQVRVVCASSTNKLPAPPTTITLVSTSLSNLIKARPASTWASSSPNGAPNAFTTTSRSSMSSTVKLKISFQSLSHLDHLVCSHF